MLRLLLALLLAGSALAHAIAPASPMPCVQIHLRADSATHSFTCRYALPLPAADSATGLRLNLSRGLHLRLLLHSAAQVRRVHYTYFDDTA